MDKNKFEQKEKVMNMTIEERKEVSKKVKQGEAYRKWKKASTRQKIRYTILLIAFFVFFALDVYSRNWGKDVHNTISVLSGVYIGAVIIYLIIESFYARSHPLVWRCPECGQFLPCRHSDFARGSDSYVPDTYVTECPHCHHDLTK